MKDNKRTLEKTTKLKKEIKQLKKKESTYENKIHEYSLKRNYVFSKYIKLTDKLKALTHKFSKGDLVLAFHEIRGGSRQYFVASIRATYGVKMYSVFEYMGSRAGVHSKIHEKQIACSAQLIPKRFKLLEVTKGAKW